MLGVFWGAMAGWTLHWVELPAGVHGLTDFDRRRVVIDCRLSPASRRRVLRHERFHVLRGPVPPELADEEEEIIDQLVARQLIPIRELADVMRWTMDEREQAAALGVDRAALGARLRGLHPAECGVLRRIAGRCPTTRA